MLIEYRENPPATTLQQQKITGNEGLYPLNFAFSVQNIDLTSATTSESAIDRRPLRVASPSPTAPCVPLCPLPIGGIGS